LVLAGLALYGLGALAWIVVLSRLDLNVAYPFLALNFVLITIISRVVLSETVPELRWVGIAFICLGILLVARSATQTQ
jgi:drug/metabolite transporter (DMT)-like permease